jgi:hypothetical protein
MASAIANLTALVSRYPFPGCDITSSTSCEEKLGHYTGYITTKISSPLSFLLVCGGRIIGTFSPQEQYMAIFHTLVRAVSEQCRTSDVCEPSPQPYCAPQTPLLIDTPDFEVSEFLPVRLYQSVISLVYAFTVDISIVPTPPKKLSFAWEIW